MDELLDIGQFCGLLENMTKEELLATLLTTIQRVDPELYPTLMDAFKQNLEAIDAIKSQAKQEAYSQQIIDSHKRLTDKLDELNQNWETLPRIAKVEINEEYDDWYAADEPEYFLVDDQNVAGLVYSIESLLEEIDAPDLWQERLELLELLLNMDLDIEEYEPPVESTKEVIEVLADLSDEVKDINQIWIGIAQSALLDRKKDLDDILKQLSKAAVRYSLCLDILSEELAEEFGPQMQRKIACKWLDLLYEQKALKNENRTVRDALDWIADSDLEKEYVLKIVDMIPSLADEFFQIYRQTASLEQQSNYLQAALANISGHHDIRAQLHDQVSLIEKKLDHTEEAIDHMIAATNEEPLFKRYYVLTVLDPDRDYLPKLDTINNNSFLKTNYSVLEGNIEPMLGVLKCSSSGHSSAKRTEMALLLCLLGYPMKHKSLHELADRFLNEGVYSHYWKTTPLDAQGIDYAQLFNRAFERAQLNETQIQMALDLLNDRILEFCEEITGSQARKEYFRCAQFVGALYYVRSLYGEKGLSADFKARYGKLVNRYPRFRAEVNDWL